MSTLTQSWSEDKIRLIIRHLDQKTGLNGASLPIKLSLKGNHLGRYVYSDEGYFNFNRVFFDNPQTKESEVINTIRHEYAHYYEDIADLLKYVDHTQIAESHGKGWSWACKKVGALPYIVHDLRSQHYKDLSEEEAQSLYNADDVEAFDILSFIKKWNQVPIDRDTTEKYLNCVRKAHPDWFHDIGDEVFHIKNGFGIIKDIVYNEQWIQKADVLFEDNKSRVFTTSVLCKVVDGKIIPPNRKSHISLLQNR